MVRATGMLAAGLAILITSGCTIKNKGTARENQPPTAFFSPVPVGNTIFTSPSELFWYATDPDGYIVEFQYSIQLDSVIRALVIDSSGGRRDSIGTPLDFVNLHNPDTDTIWHWVSLSNLNTNGQVATVAFPASRDTTKVVKSVVFIRARDDQDAYSPVVWRNYGRRNRAPNTHMGTVNGFEVPLPVTRVFYSLPQRTFNDTFRVGHQGITLTWVGSDSADYPRIQPGFTYFWELFGPFKETETLVADSARLWTTSDRERGVRYDTARSFTFYGLQGDSGNLKLARYLFRVRTQDDAGVIDASPATTSFRIVNPQFDHEVLLIRKRARASDGPTGEPSGFKDDSTQGFYVNLIRQAGYGSVFDSLRDAIYLDPTNSTITVVQLARYKMVIYHKEQVFPTIKAIRNDELIEALISYMNAGGSVWGLGRDELLDLEGGASNISSDPLIMRYNTGSPVSGFAYFYFGVEGMFVHAHVNRMVAIDSVSNEEFIGADPLVSGLPLLDVDTLATKSYLVSPLRKPAPPGLTPYYQRVPGVNYFVRAPFTEPVYLFRSPFADTSHLNGKVVAVRANLRTFKTAQFGFSLYGIQEPQAAILMRQMLEWFIGPP